MCGCKKNVIKTECARLRDFHNAEGMFVFRVIKEKFVFRKIYKGKTPFQTLEGDDRFLNDQGEIEFYYTDEHPCLTQ